LLELFDAKSGKRSSSLGGSDKLDRRMNSVKQTPLHALHRRLGARMTEFGGFEMPLSYSGIIEEHLAVRSAAGIFDLSHMGEFEISGEGAIELLEHALSNSAQRLAEGQAQYTILCAPDGGTVDDLIVYRLGPGQRYMLCVNASNIATDREWLLALPHHGVEFTDVSDETALIAVQGPQAQAILASLTDVDLASIARFRTGTGQIADVRCLIARTGYTGEDGFELFASAGDGERLFAAILDAGAPHGLKPCGLGARDTLRMEAALPLYGHELDRSTSPLQAGLASYVKFGRDFVGAAALIAQRDGDAKKRLVGLQTDDGRSIARQSYRIFRAKREIGAVTSGTFAPSFKRPLALAYVDVISGQPAVQTGDAVEVEIRDRRVPATVVPLPFYRRPKTVSSVGFVPGGTALKDS
jgi:aminomethyltransferase